MQVAKADVTGNPSVDNRADVSVYVEADSTKAQVIAVRDIRIESGATAPMGADVIIDGELLKT